MNTKPMDNRPIDNRKEELLIELLESDLTSEGRNKLLAEVVKNNISTDDIEEYKSLKFAIRQTDPANELIQRIDFQKLEHKIMNRVNQTKRINTHVENFKSTSVDHLVASQKQKTNL